MKIRKIGYTSFRLSFRDIDIITDPLLLVDTGLPFGKTTAEVVLFSGPKFLGRHDILQGEKFSKIDPKKRDMVHEISAPGEYEVGNVIIRRGRGADIYVMDEDDIRVVYVGEVADNSSLDQFSDLGDVDLLILPVGDSEIFPSYEKIEKIINKADPTYLIPSGYHEGGMKVEYAGLKSVEEFIKHFGYTHVRYDSKLQVNIGSEIENKALEVIVLDKKSESDDSEDSSDATDIGAGDTAAQLKSISSIAEATTIAGATTNGGVTPPEDSAE